MKTLSIEPSQNFSTFLSYDNNSPTRLKWIRAKGRAKVGDKAGTECGGYFRIGFCQKSYLVHRVIFSLFNPSMNIEKLDIDHINGDKLDNRIENLQLLTPSEHSLRHWKKKKAPIPSNQLSGCSV